MYFQPVLQMKEADHEEMLKGRVRFLPPRFMSVHTAIKQMLAVEATRKEGILGYVG
jgi:diphthine synthase